VAVSAASSLTADGSLLSLLTGETTSPITTAAEPIAATVRVPLAPMAPGRRPADRPPRAPPPNSSSDFAVAEAARAHGVVVDSGRRYYPAEQPDTYLRLGFAAAADPAELTEGARRLGPAVRGADSL
jgi:hypothetical protein